MPRWWPWGRSKEPAREAVALAARSEQPWRRLAPIQRTVGDIERTAELGEFTASLTTSQNPGLTGPLELLSAERPERLPVLDVVRDSVVAAVPQSRGAGAPTRQPRTWSPSPAAVQRAILGSRSQSQPTAEVATQPTADMATPVREIHPVESTNIVEPPADSLLDAPQPPEDRVLEVVSVPGWDGLPAVPAGDEARTATGSASGAPEPVGVFDPAPSVDHPVSPPSPARAGDIAAAPPRRLAAVLRAVTETTRSPEAVPSGSPPIPVVRQADSDSPSKAPRPEPAAATRREPHEATQPGHHAATTPGDGTDPPLQRAVDPHDYGAAHAETVIAVPLPEASAAPPRSIPQVSDRALPVVPTLDVSHPTPMRAPVVAQRFIPPAAKPTSAPTTPELDSNAATQSVAGALPRRDLPALPVVQRAADGVAPPPYSDGRTGVYRPDSHPPSDAAPAAAGPPPTAAGPPPTAASPPTAGVVQRLSLPVVEPPRPSTQPRISSAAGYSGTSVAPAVQRASTGGRPVILPPVRSSVHVTPTDTPHSPEGSVIFESPRPMSLQRMFEQTLNRRDRITDVGSSGSSSTTPEEPSSAADTNTVTFPQPATIQREPGGAPSAPEPAPEPAPVPASAPTMVAAPQAAGPAPPGGDVDELVNRLYDPLAARLRAELWLDRERAGVLMDLGR